MLGQADGPIHRLDRPQHVVVGDHHPLRRPRRPRGVDQGGDVVRLQLGTAAVDQVGVCSEASPAALQEVVPRQDPVGIGVLVGALHQHDVLKVRQFRLRRLPAAHVLEVLEDGDLGPAVRADVGNLRCCQSRVDGDGCSSGVHRPQVGDHMLGTVGCHQCNEVASPDTEIDEAGRRLEDLHPVLRPGEFLPVVAVPPVNGGNQRMVTRIPGEDVDDRAPLHVLVDLCPYGCSIRCHDGPPHRCQSARRAARPPSCRIPVAVMLGPGRTGILPDQSASGLLRRRFVSERRRFASSRRSRAARPGLVRFLGGAGGLAAAARRSARRRRAICRFRHCERDSSTITTTTPATRRCSSAASILGRRSSGIEGDPARSNRSSARVFDRLAC